MIMCGDAHASGNDGSGCDGGDDGDADGYGDGDRTRDEDE